MESAKMKNSKKHLTFIQAALVLIVMAGCSNVHTTERPTVRDFIVEVINDDNKAEKPPMTWGGTSIVTSSVRPHSNRSSQKNVEEPAVQEVQGNILLVNNEPGTEYTFEPQLHEPETIRPEELNVASQNHETVLIDGAPREIYRAKNTNQEPMIENISEEIIAVVEVIDEDNIANEPSSALTGRSSANSSDRSNSIWTSRKPLGPTAQGVQGYILQANDLSDITPNEYRAKTRPAISNVTSQKHEPVLVGDTLKEVLNGSNTIKEPTVMDAIVNVIGDDNEAEDSSIK
jgi:hypothetical protein